MAKSTKTKLIKKYFGEFITEEGFEYVGADSVGWKYTRQKESVTQEIYICKERFFPNHITLSLFTKGLGWGMQEPKDFVDQYKDQMYWEFETEEEFIEIIQEFAKIMKEYGLDMLDKMCVPKEPDRAVPKSSQPTYESYLKKMEELKRKYAKYME